MEASMFTPDPELKAKRDVEADKDPSPPQDGLLSPTRDAEEHARDDTRYAETYSNMQEKRAADALEEANEGET